MTLIHVASVFSLLRAQLSMEEGWGVREGMGGEGRRVCRAHAQTLVREQCGSLSLTRKAARNYSAKPTAGHAPLFRISREFTAHFKNCIQASKTRRL